MLVTDKSLSSGAKTLPAPTVPPGHLSFTCCICGHSNCEDLARVAEREIPTCVHCSATLRFRALTAALQECLFGKITALQDLLVRKELRGLGMSDEPLYANLLSKKFTYTNTFFHREPFLDITKPPGDYQAQFDFLMTSDVLEHVCPPMEKVFANLRSLLRPSGVLALTTPFGYQPDTLEHFPELYQFEILGQGNERYLVNTTRSGKKETFRNLVFHGGPGATLEMRLFSEPALKKLLRDAGFKQIQVHAAFLPQWGLVHRRLFSLPITAVAA